MPLCRYQIRNELGLADREVYKAADKDDPEALLHAFAMAGLVGILRQLGDLAQFAAEIFSDLHDEIAATAARSHGVMVRAQHLEMEIPLIEKTFLKHTNRSSFFYTAGSDWHPNKHTDQNCITKGDLPRFIADLYEETRGPPSFIFLDRFDIKGEGACLKRYTNPSFYNVEAAALGTTNSDVHGENKSRKGKRRGTQWRNRRTPNALPTPHAKLHQLLLEETIEDNVTSHVKMKRRQNGFPFHLRNGKSYMEKILKDHSPEHELLKRDFIGSVPSDLDAEVERKFNSSESPDMQLTNKNRSRKPELKNDVSDHFLGEKEKKITVDREGKAKATMVGYQSDDVTSVVEIYINKLSSEPQIDSDSKLVTKTDFHVSSNRKQWPGLDVTKSLHQAHFPDFQPMGSEDGISSFKKYISTSSYSEDVSKIARTIHLEEEVSNAYLVNEIFEAKSTPRQLKWRGCARCTDVADNLALNSDNNEKAVSNDILAKRGKDTTLGNHGVLKVRKGGMGAQDFRGTEPSNGAESEIKLEQNVAFNSNTSITPFQGNYGCSFGVLATEQALTSVEDNLLYMHECFSCVPNIPDTSYSRRASKGQDMEELEDMDLSLDTDDGENVSAASLNMPQAEEGIDCKASSVVSQLHSPITIVPPAKLPDLKPRWKTDEDQDLKEKKTSETAKEFAQTDGAEVGTSSILIESLPGLPNSAECGRFREFTSITHLGERDAAYCGSILGVNRSDADVERDEKELNQCEMETGVSEASDGNLLPKSNLKKRETSNNLHQEEYHNISPLSFFENLKNQLQQSCYDLLRQGNATKTNVGMPKVPPAPPFPPVQRKMGTDQPISLAHQNKAVSDNEGPSLSQSGTNQKTHNAVLGKHLPLVHESTSGNSVHEDPFSSLVHVIENHGDEPLRSLGKIESVTQNLPLSANVDEILQRDDHIGPNSNTISQGTTAVITAADDTGQTHHLAAMNQQKGAPLRNPLINTIVAHGKTKLKKVTEGTGSNIQIPDGRDSLLEQIRTKAFNLKPTVVQRPSIQVQGPTTNLRVAAILQKAKTIRHAFSLSDEDDDDSWSD